MSILNTKHKRKSTAITALLLMLLIFGILNFGMHYLDPPEEYGLAINYGNSALGSGAPVEKTKKEVPKKAAEKQAFVEEKVIEIPKEIIKDELISSDTPKDVPVVAKKKETKEEFKNEVLKENKKPKAFKESQDALTNLLKANSSEGKPKGEGDDKVPGVKGEEKGAINSSKYYGNTGSGSDGAYNLAGRRALLKPKEQPDCEEEGTVVVGIQVDKNGKVVHAMAGIKGTTNSAPCLLKPAKQAALRTQWNADSKAPTKQVGTIIYKFTLSK
jgi:protein TonB